MLSTFLCCATCDAPRRSCTCVGLCFRGRRAGERRRGACTSFAALCTADTLSLHYIESRCLRSPSRPRPLLPGRAALHAAAVRRAAPLLRRALPGREARAGKVVRAPAARGHAEGEAALAAGAELAAARGAAARGERRVREGGRHALDRNPLVKAICPGHVVNPHAQHDARSRGRRGRGRGRGRRGYGRENFPCRRVHASS